MKAIFSWRSPSAKPLGLSEATANDEALLALMLREPRLIRRPIVLVGEQPIIGGDPKALAQALGEPA